MECECFAPVNQLVRSLFDYFDPAKILPNICAQKFIVIAWHINAAGTFATLAQQLLHNHVMWGRPVFSGANHR